jgi:alpha-tubulin suppressor-like RCC1 family protein
VLFALLLLAMAAFATPAQALTCLDQAGGSQATPIDVTYFLTADGCTKFDPGDGVLMTAQVQDASATVTFLRPGATDPVVSTSFTTGPGCTINGGVTAANVAGYKIGNSVTCTTTVRLTNGAEFRFNTVNDTDGFAASLTGVSFTVPATATTVTATPNPSSFGQSVTFAATVRGGVGAPADVVDFKDGATTLGSGVLADAGSGLSVVSIASGSNSDHACAITTAGGVRCWGGNAENQLGDGTSVQSSIPVDVFGLTSGVVAISAGASHSCALTSAGGVKCWGSNAAGRLGDNTGNGATSPVDVFGLTSGVAAIAVGAAHSCALTSAGGVKCWGFNSSGQLGNNTVASALAPVDVSGLSTGVRAIAAGANHTCAMTTAGVQCWGNNAKGQLGDGTTDNRLVPTTIPFFANTALNVAISAGAGHSCALLTTAGGTPFCWGANGAGQLGADPALISQKLFPDNANNQFPSGGVSAMSAGADHTCFLLASGAARCLGGNGFGQLGNNTTESDFLAVDVASLGTGVKAIVAGNGSTYAVTTGLGAKAWGSNQFERLGDGTDTNRSLAVDISELSAGRATASLSTSTLPVGNRSITGAYVGDTNRTGSTSAALTQTINKATNVITFPALANRALGTAAPVPAATASSGLAVTYASTTAAVCTVTAPGVITLVSVGTCSITASQAGNANFLAATPVAQAFSVTKAANTVTFPALVNATFSSAAPVPAATASSGLAVTYASTTASVCTATAAGVITLVSVGTCTITASQAGNANFLAATPVVRSFSVTQGANVITFPALANTAFGNIPPVPAATASSGLAVTFASTTTAVCTATSAGVITLVSVGTCSITASQAGSGNFVAATSVVRAFSVTQAATATTVASSLNPSAFGQAVTFTARVRAATGSAVPTGPVTITDTTTGAVLGTPTLAAVTQAKLSAGGSHACSVSSDGGVSCWGNNLDGQLGDGTTTNRLVPVPVVGLSSGVAAVAAGGRHSCALTTAGAVLCWGVNGNGQIGDGTLFTQRFTPTPVAGLSSGVVAIDAGGDHSCALKTTGALVCWGFNGNGQIGDGTTSNNRPTPVPVTGLSSGVKAVSASNSHSCALTTAGAILCWGHNLNGRVGDGTQTDRLTPVPVSGLSSGVAAIDTGTNAHSCAVTTAGAVKCWGINFSGQLGDGTLVDRFTPVAVPSLSSGAVAIATGGGHSCAVTTAGAASCWGSNFAGRLGDGTTTDRLVPTQVVGLSSGVAAIALHNGAQGCALTTAGAVRCWGLNDNGELGDGTTTARLTPVATRHPGASLASIATSSLAAGAHAIRADYAGNANFAASVSPLLTQTVNKAANTITFPALPNRAFGSAPPVPAATASSGLAISYSSTTASVCTATGAGVITLVSVGTCSITASQAGNANFLAATPVVRSFTVTKGANVITFPALPNRALGTAAPVPAASASSGLAVTYASTTAPVCTTTAAGVITLVSVGTCSISASQAGNASFLAAAPVVRAFSVTPAASTSTVTTSGSPSIFGAAVTFTATVSATAGGTPSGSVTFRDGAASLGVRTLSGGTASLSTTALGVGARSITVVYGGSAVHAASTSAALTQTVTRAATTTTLTATPNPTLVNGAVTLRATVAGQGATGNVAFRNGATTIATVALTNGAATTTFTPTSAGTRSLSAVYAGNGNVNGSTSGTLGLLAHVPCSDPFAGAPALAGANGAVFGTTAGATGEAGEPNHAGSSGALNSVWCRWTAPASGPVTFDTTGSSFDTTLAVYTGGAVNALTQMAANNNIAAGNTRSRVTFAATAGTVYRIAIDGVSATGTYVLNFAQAAAAPTTFASVLPTARSITTNTVATAFATMINAGTAPATGCSLAAPPGSRQASATRRPTHPTCRSER